MARTWLIDSRTIAKKIRGASNSAKYQIKDYGANRECPNCRHYIDNSDVSHEWPGFPAGVKFDPSDAELVQHLSAKCGVDGLKSHQFIDEFIPTLDQGICCTHPENLPGTKKDGSWVHYFYIATNAYASGQRKRRKIQNGHGLTEDRVRWHKTGKTKAIVENGVVKGWKKIMVLYSSSKKGLKADKSNWVMHQYHLGTEEEEKEGEYVVSKVSYQQSKQIEKNDNEPIPDVTRTLITRASPKTPAIITPQPPRKGKSAHGDDIAECSMAASFSQAKVVTLKVVHASPDLQLEDTRDYHASACLAGESQVDDQTGLDDEALLCSEIFSPFPAYDNWGPSSSCFPHNSDYTRDSNPCGVADLENLDFDTPPDFQLSDLQFGSEDSVFDWLDRI